MKWRLLTSSLLLGATFCVAGAHAACGPLEDPNSDDCMKAKAIRLDPRAGEPGKGQTVCAFFDEKTQRCLTVRPNTKQYDSAVSTGVQSAMMMMQVQADAWEEARRSGLVPAANVPTMALGGKPQYNDCVKTGLDQIAHAQDRKATPEQVSMVLKGCAQ